MSRFSILLGGEIHRTPELHAQISATRVIAADSGMQHAETLGILPELWVGDFDSVSEELQETYSRVPRRTYPSEKDQTDGEIAIEAAMDLGATSLMLVGAFGGTRPDHAYMHLAQAMRLAESGIPTLLSSGAQEGCPLLEGRHHSFGYADGTLFSILPFNELSGLTVEGAKWPLEAVKVPFASSLTMSNEVRGGLGIRLDRGRALLIAHLILEEGN